MLSTPEALCVERVAANARIRIVARLLLSLFLLAALCAPLMAQEASGEANLKLPRLDSVHFPRRHQRQHAC